MKSIVSLAALAAMVLGSTVAAPAADKHMMGGMHAGGMHSGMMMTPHRIVVKLDAIGGSGESGTATLSQNIGSPMAGTVVTLSLHGGSAAPQPAHIHIGVCGSNGPIKYPLKPVTEGKSTTVVRAKLSYIMSLGAYINVHKSPADLATIVSCGNIPHAGAGAM